MNRNDANASQLRRSARRLFFSEEKKQKTFVSLSRFFSAELDKGIFFMQTFIGLLRAVNVGGTGKVAMEDLKAMCAESGFHAVRTYIASGNVIFRSTWMEEQVKTVLEDSLRAYAGKPVGVAVRSAAEMAAIAEENPFADAPGNRVMAIFLDRMATASDLDNATGRARGEFLALGRREIFVHYGNGMANTKLRIAAAKYGTARNLNTVAKLAALSAEVSSGSA